MSRRTAVTKIGAENVPDDARVRHYDELDERAKEYLDAVATGRDRPFTDGGRPEPVADLRSGDVVVFTDYYRVA
jgi:hypothetical protein